MGKVTFHKNQFEEKSQEGVCPSASLQIKEEIKCGLSKYVTSSNLY